ncbi:efflux RND transporter periplasmic adaptor subunit [Pseudaestuariivita rosea]|uniref:efflux RND transporter periplasmic adaptor subunit n=1 Tax=Pseudaestuariivita rosea TaxID=2763263 RepID=UPI001ABAB899|nr:efflux RND transporter periplasmic adaptor subunit [Pseudaestuariivita rosea]
MKTKLFATAICLPCFAFAQDLVEVAETDDVQAIFVQTYVVPEGSGTSTRQFFGQIAALETVDISFEVGGYLTEIEAQEGSRVSAGTPIAALDLAPFERAVERAELALAQAERDRVRAAELASRNVSSEVRAQDAETSRDLADVALREAREALADAQISAPFDGLIADRIATPFSTIQPGQPILRIHNMSEVRVEFDLPERVLSQIGDLSAIRFEGALANSDSPIDLTFREFRAETGRVGQSYTVSLAAETEQSPFLLPGRTIVVSASVEAAQDTIVIPASAIATRPDGAQVVVLVQENQKGGLIARYQPVDVTSTNGTTFQVRGLAPGNEIVRIGAHLIDEDMPLKRFVGLTVEGS